MTDVVSGEPGGFAAPVNPYAPPAPPVPAAEPSTMDVAWTHASEKVQDVADAAGKAYEATREAAGNLVTRVRNNATLPAERGHTTIANEVVEKIAGIAAREVPGVYDLGGDAARLVSAVRERLHLGEEGSGQGVSVKLEGKQAEVTVVIVIEFGFQVFSVTEKVREKVISSVENLLGLEVTAVDVTVDDVHISDETPPGNDAERAVGYNPETKAIVVGAPAAN
ncbi:MAG TPA: Asp23/Gls24 family envelope stress response protein [Rugosimonospora sp.]|nr:Asp23/Gls24 family envelope stress response protein [Rugosimonospora sp.]